MLCQDKNIKFFLILRKARFLMEFIDYFDLYLRLNLATRPSLVSILPLPV